MWDRLGDFVCSIASCVAHYLPKPSTSSRWGWGGLRPKSQWYFTIERRHVK